MQQYVVFYWKVRQNMYSSLRYVFIEKGKKNFC